MFDLVGFHHDGISEAFTNVANLYRDGTKVESLEQDINAHNYEFDSGYNGRPYDQNYQLKWAHRTFRGKIAYFEQGIKE